jgi:hypothetical protein
MTSPALHPRVIRLAHASPGRLRVRLHWLHEDRDAAVALADHLAGLDGVIDVAVRPHTGSVLCRYDERRTDGARLLAAVRRHTRVASVLRADQPLPAAARPGARSGSSLGRVLADLVRGLDADVAEATGGRIDLGVLAGLGLLGAGAAEIAVTRQIPAPPWFSLAWWAFRTFTMFEPPPAAPAPSRRRQMAALPRAGSGRRNG